jgi:hypothetical protein
MLYKTTVAAALGTLGLFAWAGAARADDDLVRLNGGRDTPTLTLKDDGQSETILTRGGRGGGGARGGGARIGGARVGVRVGPRGGVGVRVGRVGVAVGPRGRVGVRVGFRAGGVRFVRGPWGGVRFVRGPWGGVRFVRVVRVGVGPWWFGFRPRFWYGNFPYPDYYYGSYPYYGVPTTSAYYNYPPTVVAPRVVMPYAPDDDAVVPNGSVVPTPPVPSPGTPIPPGDGTFPYDGGPAEPVPQPRVVPGPTSAPPGVVPAPGLRPVSLPRQVAPRVTYPAYGDRPAPTPAPSGRTYVTGTR